MGKMTEVGSLRRQTLDDIQDNKRAMKLSLAIGLLMLVGKGTAYILTDSAAVFSDVAESVVHVLAVAFATFSLWFSLRPATSRFTFGHERISFFSAGFEGALIILAAVLIVLAAIEKLRTGQELENLGLGAALVAIAGAVNAGLGLYLVRTGQRTKSVILEANGRHVLTDSWTSLGVVGGLLLVLLTGWRPFDPLCALAVAANIIWSGGRLVYRSVNGLLDYSDPAVGQELRKILDHLCADLGILYHGVRFRNTGFRLHIELHLLFPEETPLGVAHSMATQLEEQLPVELGIPALVVTHLEALEDHGQVHRERHYMGMPR